jgi:hypothetical protein
MLTPRNRATLAALTAALFVPAAANAAVMYTINGSTYTQNFDSLPITPENANIETATVPMKWADDTTPTANIVSIPGWYLYHAVAPASEGGTNGHQRMRITSGSSTTGAFYSFGSTGSTERALGDVGSTTIASNPPGDQNIYTGLRLTNGTADALDSLTITYTGEQWRNNGNTASDTIFFSYSLDPAATVNSGAYTSVSALDFTSPVFSATAATLDGNAAANRSTKTATISGIFWAPGTDLWLRWDDLQIGGNDHALGIDDLSFTATPEPTTLALLTAALPLAARRRRR